MSGAGDVVSAGCVCSFAIFPCTGSRTEGCGKSCMAFRHYMRAHAVRYGARRWSRMDWPSTARAVPGRRECASS